PIPSPPEGERAAGRAETLASSEEARAEMGEGAGSSLEEQEPTVNDEGIAGVIAARVAGQVDGDAAEVVAHAPAPQRHPRQDLLHEGLAVERLLRHGRIDPAGHDGVHADLVAR